MTTRRFWVFSDQQRALWWRIGLLAYAVLNAVWATAWWSSAGRPAWWPYFAALAVVGVVLAVLNVVLAGITYRASRASITLAGGAVIACRVVPGEQGGLDAVPRRWLGPLERVVDYRTPTYGERAVRFVVQRGYNFGVTAGGPGRPHPPQTWYTAPADTATPVERRAPSCKIR